MERQTLETPPSEEQPRFQLEYEFQPADLDFSHLETTELKATTLHDAESEARELLKQYDGYLKQQTIGFVVRARIKKVLEVIDIELNK